MATIRAVRKVPATNPRIFRRKNDSRVLARLRSLQPRKPSILHLLGETARTYGLGSIELQRHANRAHMQYGRKKEPLEWTGAPSIIASVVRKKVGTPPTPLLEAIHQRMRHHPHTIFSGVALAREWKLKPRYLSVAFNFLESIHLVKRLPSESTHRGWEARYIPYDQPNPPIQYPNVRLDILFRLKGQESVPFTHLHRVRPTTPDKKGRVYQSGNPEGVFDFNSVYQAVKKLETAGLARRIVVIVHPEKKRAKPRKYRAIRLTELGQKIMQHYSPTDPIPEKLRGMLV